MEIITRCLVIFRSFLLLSHYNHRAHCLLLVEGKHKKIVKGRTALLEVL